MFQEESNAEVHDGKLIIPDYQYSAEASLAAIREYALTEPKRMKQA